MKALIRKFLRRLTLPRRTAYLNGLIAAQTAWRCGPDVAQVLDNLTLDPMCPGDFDRGCQDGLRHFEQHFPGDAFPGHEGYL